MSARQQRINELIAARERIDAQILRLDPARATGPLPEADPIAHASTVRLAAMARQMVWNGSTHREVAEALHIPASSVAPLIARRSA